jgi:hypothetical protein
MYEVKWFKVFVIDTGEELEVFNAGVIGHHMIPYYQDKHGTRYKQTYKEYLKNTPKTNLPLMEVFDLGSSVKSKCEEYIERLKNEDSFESYLITQLLKEKTDMGFYKDLYVLARKYKLKHK